MDGVLIIDKPAGFTSHDVVARVRRILNVRRAGHTGTLDPFATGVLVVLVGRATRLAQFLSGAEKEYEATIRFGYATDTGDVTGQRLDADVNVSAKTESLRGTEIEAALASLRGEIEQTPPMYSAKKIKGQKLYALARRGEEVERAAVRVNISQFDVSGNGLLLKSNDDGSCELKVRVVCSAGTYVRTLAESVGQFLGVAAHLSELRRTRAGQFRIEGAITLSDLEQAHSEDTGAGFLISPAEALSHLPSVTLSAEDEQRTRNGMGVPLTAGAETPAHSELLRMLDAAGNLLAVGFYDEVKEFLRPTVVIASA